MSVEMEKELEINLKKPFCYIFICAHGKLINHVFTSSKYIDVVSDTLGTPQIDDP